MPLDMPRLTSEQRVVEGEREAVWLRALEAGNTTIDDLSIKTGLSKKRLWARLRRARENRDPEGELSFSMDCELPWVEIVDRIHAPNQYDLETNALSLEHPGPFRINNGRGHLQVHHERDGQKNEGIRNDKYNPDPNHAGGVEKVEPEPKRPRRKKTG